MTKLFSAAELARHSRPPHQCIADATAEGSGALRDEVELWEHRYRRGLRGLAAWMDGSVAALGRHDGGLGAVSELLAGASWRIAVANGITQDDLAILSERRGATIVEAREGGGIQAAIDAYGQLEGAYRRLHDARCDLVSVLWSTLLERAGRPALEACLRSLASESLMIWMEVDRMAPPAERLVEWATVMRANFSAIRIEEHADRFEITSDPCGSCTRQLLDGRCETLAIRSVAPFGPEHVGTSDVPVYRSHVGLMHWLMPLERIGAPWPIVVCPPGAGVGPCTLTLEK